MFYLIEITTYNNSTPVAKGVYNYNTLDEALASFFGKLRGAIINETYATELCIIIDGRGSVKRYEYWERPIEISNEG